MLNPTENTKAFLTDMRQLARRPKSAEDRRKYASRNVPKSIEKLYTGNTDDFEPIIENRQHLLNTLVPLTYSIARRIAGRFGDKIELDDCINSGIIGAVLATDRYIEKSKTSKQPAKLSSFAYVYIEKYVNEHCRRTNTLLSHGATEWQSASESFVKSGNSLVGGGDDKNVELFDIINCNVLRSSIDDEYQERINRATKYVTKLFSNLSTEERNIILMYFGISDTAKTTREIAKTLKIKAYIVGKQLPEIINKMKLNITDSSEISEAIETLSKINIYKLIK